MVTQLQIMQQTARSLAERDLVFLHMMKTNPITREEFDHLVLTRPDVWARYAAYFGRSQR